MTAGLPFDDVRNLIRQLPAVDAGAGKRVREDLAGASLGRIADLAAWLAAATGRAPARVARPVVALFAATHAVSRRLGAADWIAEARAGVEDIAAGAAPISHLCAANNLGLNVFDLALELPVEDFARAPALEERAAAATMAFGMEAVATGADLICLGTVDNAGDPSAMTLLSGLAGTDGREWEGSDAVLQVVDDALKLHAGHLGDPLEALRRLGGREIAALAGAILAARTQKVAVILDGLPATAAAATLYRLAPGTLDHCLLAATASTPHRKAAARIGLEPILELGVAGGGAIAGALAAGLIRTAGDISVGMAEVRRRRSRS